MAAGSWRLAAGGWRLAAGGWQLNRGAANGYETHCRSHSTSYIVHRTLPIGHRLFVAIRPPAEVARRLAALRADVPGARWLNADGLHLTLKFLGEVGEVDAVASALATVDGEPLRVSLDTIAAYPSPARARVLVAEGPSNAGLDAAHRRVETALAFVSPREARPFRAHITLARLKSPDTAAVRRWLAAPAPGLSFVAHEIVLFEGRPSPAGAIYVPIAVRALSD